MVLPRGTSYLRADFRSSSFFIGIIERKIFARVMCGKSNRIFSSMCVLPRGKIWKKRMKNVFGYRSIVVEGFHSQVSVKRLCVFRLLYTFVTINQNCCFFFRKFVFSFLVIGESTRSFSKETVSFRRDIMREFSM